MDAHWRASYLPAQPKSQHFQRCNENVQDLEMEESPSDQTVFRLHRLSSDDREADMVYPAHVWIPQHDVNTGLDFLRLQQEQKNITDVANVETHFNIYEPNVRPTSNLLGDLHDEAVFAPRRQGYCNGSHFGCFKDFPITGNSFQNDLKFSVGNVVASHTWEKEQDTASKRSMTREKVTMSIFFGFLICILIQRELSFTKLISR